MQQQQPGTESARATAPPGTETARAAWAAGAPLPRLELEDSGRSGLMSTRLGMDGGRSLGFAIGSLGDELFEAGVGCRAGEWRGGERMARRRRDMHGKSRRRRRRELQRGSTGAAWPSTRRAGARAEWERGCSARALAEEAARRWRRRSGSPSMPIDTGDFFPTVKMPSRCASLRGKKRFLGVETISWFSSLFLH